MKQQQTKWTIQEQEQEGDYFFSGRLYTTATIQEKLTALEIAEIVMQVRMRVKEKKRCRLFASI